MSQSGQQGHFSLDCKRVVSFRLHAFRLFCLEGHHSTQSDPKCLSLLLENTQTNMHGKAGVKGHVSYNKEGLFNKVFRMGFSTSLLSVGIFGKVHTYRKLKRFSSDIFIETLNHSFAGFYRSLVTNQS